MIKMMMKNRTNEGLVVALAWKQNKFAAIAIALEGFSAPTKLQTYQIEPIELLYRHCVSSEVQCFAKRRFVFADQGVH